MPDIKASHQGVLRGSVMLPVEPTSDAEVGYKTALSEVDSDDDEDGSDAGKAQPSHQQKQQQQQQQQQQQRQRQQYSSNAAGDDHETRGLPADPGSEQPSVGTLHGYVKKKTPNDSPAYVAPIPKIPGIPSIPPVPSSRDQAAASRRAAAQPPRKPPVHEIPKGHLVGKRIDEFGDIVDDDDNGKVLGRVEGDLPSMVGRTIANARGDVLGDDGELLGYVAAVGAGEDGQANPEQTEVPTRSLSEVMQAMSAAGKGPGGLRVDPFGNILDAQGNAVGSFHDNLTGFGTKAAEFARDASDGASSTGGSASPPHNQGFSKDTGTTGRAEAAPAPAAAPESRPKENAQSHRKEDPALSPSDIFMDVKSTKEGIQLTIRIPTVFNASGEPRQPKIVFE